MFRQSVKLLNNWASTAVLVLLMLLPIYGPYMVYAEGQFFPVTSKISPVDIEQTTDGMTLRFSYTKFRASCELTGTAWYFGNAEVDFHPMAGGGPTTRMGGAQTSRRWFTGAKSLEGSTVWFLHRCHPFWMTATKVFG